MVCSLASAVKVGPFIKGAPTADDAEIVVADDLGVGATDPLTDADTVGEVIFIRGKHGDQVSPTETFIINRQGLIAGRATDRDRLAIEPVSIKKRALGVTDNRAQGKQPFLAVIPEFEGDSRMAGKTFMITDKVVPIRTEALGEENTGRVVHRWFDRRFGGIGTLTFEETHSTIPFAEIR